MSEGSKIQIAALASKVVTIYQCTIGKLLKKTARNVGNSFLNDPGRSLGIRTIIGLRKSAESIVGT